MSKEHKFDYILAIAAAILIILGILVLASVSAIFSQEKFGKTTYYLFHQITHGLIPGIILGFIAFKLPLSFFKKWGLILILLNLLLMALVFFPGIGIIAGGAPRWLDFGFISFQPSEFLKLTFILYLATWLSSRIKEPSLKKIKKTWKYTLIPFLIIIAGITFLLTLQSDVSTLGVIVSVAALMYFLANTPFWHSILIFLLCTGGIALLAISASYRIERLLVFFKPETDPMGIGYQIKQALIAVGSGGIFGLGLGMSQQKFGFIPHTMSDAIFAIFAEETGFIGSLILISLFLVFFWRGFKIVKESQDKFSQLCAIGLTSWICLQAFVNIGSIIGLLPLSGIPLPFISYGGSHLVAELISIGILLNISKSGKK